MSGGGHGHKPHPPKITVSEVDALPGRGERIPGQDTLEHHRAYVLEKHRENAKPYFETAFGLQRAHSSIPTPEAKMVGFEQIDGAKGLLEAMNHTTGQFDPYDNLFLGYMNLTGMKMQAEAHVNLDAFDATPNGDIPTNRNAALDLRFDSVGKLAGKITKKQGDNIVEIAALRQKGETDLESSAEKAARLAKISQLQQENQSLVGQAEVLNTYKTRLFDRDDYYPAGNEADRFFDATEDAKIIRANGEEPSAALLEEIRVTKANLEEAMKFHADEANAFQVMAIYDGRIPNDVSQLEPDEAIMNTWNKQPGSPASEKLEAELRKHNDEQDFLYALETELNLSSEKYAKQNSTLVRKAMGAVAFGAASTRYGAHKAIRNYRRKRSLPRNVTRKPGETDAELAARRNPHPNRGLRQRKNESEIDFRERLKRHNERQAARAAKRPERPVSKRERYELARDAYLDEKLKHIADDITLSDSEVFNIQSHHAVEENARMIKLTNEYAKKSVMGNINWLVHERMSTPQRVLAGAVITAIGGPGMLAFALAGYAGSKADNATRGKMGKWGNQEAWKKKMTAGLAEQSHNRLRATVGGNFTRENMQGLEYDQKFLTMKEINEYLGGHYNKAVAGEMSRRLIGPAVGFASLGGLNNLDKLWVIDSFPNPMDLLDTLDEATTPTTPDGSYGARAMSQRIGMN